MTYKMTVPPNGPTGDVRADIAAIFRWIRDFSREHEIDKARIRDALQDAGAGLVFPTTDGSANQILETDGAGTLSFVDQGSTIASYSDATRGSAGTAGRVIFNTTDGNLNIDDGTNWILPDGTPT